MKSDLQVDYTPLAYFQTFKIAFFNVLLLNSSNASTHHDIIHMADS